MRGLFTVFVRLVSRLGIPNNYINSQRRGRMNKLKVMMNTFAMWIILPLPRAVNYEQIHFQEILPHTKMATNSTKETNGKIL